jgi:hypothetical protein
MSRDDDQNAEFEAFLRRRSPMHRRLSQIDHAEPPEELDRIVLARARDALATPTPQPMYHKARWAMPLGLAATILIAFTLVLNIDDRRAASPASQASGASTARLQVPAAAPPPQLPRRAAPEAAERQGFEESKRVAARAAPPAEHGPDAAETTDRPPPTLTARAAANRNVGAGSDDASAEASAPGELAARREPTVASSRTPLPAAPASDAAFAAKAAAAPASPDAGTHASPEAWLREIDRLRAAGRHDEADRELEAFRRAYPAHPTYSVAQPPTR